MKLSPTLLWPVLTRIVTQGSPVSRQHPVLQEAAREAGSSVLAHCTFCWERLRSQ